MNRILQIVHGERLALSPETGRVDWDATGVTPMFDNMGLVSGFLFLSLLWVCSAGLWKILDSVIYRVTKNEKKYGMVGASFIASMAVVVLILVASNPGLISPHHTLSEWPFMTLVYCCTAAAIVFVVSMFGLLDFVFGRLMETIRGEK